MRRVVTTEPSAPRVEMVPFPQIEALPPLPPAPGEQPISRRRRRAALFGEAIGAVGALLLLGSLFAGGWHHVNHIAVSLGTRQMNDSYVGNALETYTNSYSLAVWAFLKRGYAISVVVAAMATAVASLCVVGTRRRGIVAVGLPCGVAAIALILLDLRHLPATVTEMATHFPAFPSAVRVDGGRPGPMMIVALGGLALQISGTFVALCALPRVRRARRASPTERQAEREEQAIDQFEPRGAREYAVQRAATLPQQTADERRHEGQGEERQYHPG